MSLDRDIKVRVIVKDDGSVVLQTIGDRGGKAMTDIERSSGQASAGLSRLNRSVLDTAQGFILAEVAMNGVRSSMRFVSEEISSGLGAVEDFNLSAATMTAYMTTFGKQAKDESLSDLFRKSHEYALELIPALEVMDAKTVATGKDLSAITETMMMHGVILDINNQKQVSGFLNIANALKMVTAGQNQDVQIRQEINALLEGNIRMTDRLPRILKAIDPALEDHLRLWKEEGTTIENAGRLLAGFGQSSALIEDTWSAIGSTLETVHTRVLRGAMKPAYDDLLDIALRIKHAFMDDQGNLTDLARDVQSITRETWVMTKDVSAEVGILVGDLKDLYDVLDKIQALPGSKSEWGIIGFALLAGGPQAAALTWALTGLVDKVEHLDMFSKDVGYEPGNWLEKWKSFRADIANVWEGTVGDRDFNTGQMLDLSLPELENQLKIAKDMVANWRGNIGDEWLMPDWGGNNASPGGWLMDWVYGEDPLTHWENITAELEAKVNRLKKPVLLTAGLDSSLDFEYAPETKGTARTIEASDQFDSFRYSKEVHRDKKKAADRENLLADLGLAPPKEELGIDRALDSVFSDLDAASEEFHRNEEDRARKSAEATRKHRQEMTRLRGSYDELTLAALPEHERGLESVRRRYEQLEELLPDLFDAGLVTWEEATALQEELGLRMEEEIEAVKNKTDELTQFQIQAFRNMQQAGSNFFFGIMRNEYDDLGDHAVSMIQRMVAEWMSAKAMMAMFGPEFGKGGALGGALGWAATGISTFFAANGAVIDGHFEPVQRFAMGAPRIDRATLGWVGEGTLPEAIVPLPDGRTIPVTLSGAMGGTQIINDIDVTVTAPAGNGQAFDPKAAEAYGKAIAAAIESKVNEVLLKNMRPGGLLNQDGAH